jgi:HEAT repeat protein
MKKRTLFFLWGLPVLALMFLSGCGDKHADTIKRVDKLIAEKQFGPALDTLQIAIQRDPQSVSLKRQRVMLLIKADRIELAYPAFRELEKVSQNDQLLLQLLSDKDPAVRSNAARVLGLDASPSAIQGLTQALKDPEQTVRRSAVCALGDIKDDRAVDPLIMALQDKWWFVRSEAALGLGKIRNTKSAEPLFAAMKDTDSTVQLSAENALLTLGRLPNAPHDVFTAHINDSNPEILRVALLCLAMMKDKASTNGLLLLLDSKESRKRAQVVRALGIAQDPDGLPAVRKELNDKEIVVRNQAIEALGEYRDLQSVEALKVIANNTSEDPRLRQQAATALNKIVQGSEAPGR